MKPLICHTPSKQFGILKNKLKNSKKILSLHKQKKNNFLKKGEEAKKHKIIN